jgi:hypothetical protein
MLQERNQVKLSHDRLNFHGRLLQRTALHARATQQSIRIASLPVTLSCLRTSVALILLHEESSNWERDVNRCTVTRCPYAGLTDVP